jgi:DNA-binding MarR family transcriptional regulator
LLNMNRSADTSSSTRLAGKLVRLARKLSAQEARDLESIGNGPSQHALLGLIMEIPGICLTVAAARLAVDKSAVTRAVRRLELNGYVERRRSRRDRRAWELHPTRSAGVASWVASPCALSPAVRLLAGFNDEDLGRLRDYLDRMDANLEVPAAEVVRRAVWGRTGGPA